jgi:hypothetical protein
METFKAASLVPFVPKSTEVWQAEFKMGKNSDDHFMPSIPFEVKEELQEIYV